MSFIHSPFYSQTQEIVENQPIHSSFTVFDLPKSYLHLLETSGCGLLLYPKLLTSAPTRDGLNYVYINGIFGLHENRYFPSILDSSFTPEQTGLPDYFIVFFKDGDKYFCFDYSSYSKGKEPSIRYIDTEMDQWLTIAENFSALIEHLQPREDWLESVETEFLGSFYEASHMMATLPNANIAQAVLEQFQDYENKEWYIEWLLYWIQPSSPICELAIEQLVFQLDFFAYQIHTKPIIQRLKQWKKERSSIYPELNQLIEEFLQS